MKLGTLEITAIVAGALFVIVLGAYLMQKNGKSVPTGKGLNVYLWYPTQNRLLQRRIKPQPDGTLLLNDDKVQVVLDPSMTLQTGQVIIDAEKGIQIRYEGIKGWVGIDGRYTYAVSVKRDARDLQTRGWDLAKYAWPITIGIGIVFAAFVAMGIIAVS